MPEHPHPTRDRESEEPQADRFPRREFVLRTGAATSLVAGAAGCWSGGGSDSRETSSARHAASTAGLSTWEGVRKQFEIDASALQFTGFLLASHPRPVREAIETHRRGLDFDPHGYLEENEQAFEERVREAAAFYLDVDGNGIGLTDSTTMGLGLVYGGLELRAGDEVVTTEHDFYSTHEALRLATSRAGASLRKVRLYGEPESASADEIVSALRNALGARTRYLAVTWVHSSTGVKLPIRAIADMLAGANAGRRDEERVLLCVDGVHGFGVDDALVGELGCDLFSSGCHKWLFGPRGTGVVWGTAEAWGRVRAIIPTFDNQAIFEWQNGNPPLSVQPGPLMTPGGFHSFEHRWALAEAFAFQEQIGVQRVAERVRILAGRLKEGLAEIPRVRLRTPISSELSAGLVCFEIEGSDPREVVDRLLNAHEIVASVTPYATRYVRLGPSILNDFDEVDQVLAAVRKLA